jgi:hypothetical protein
VGSRAPAPRPFMIHSGGDLPCRPVCLGAHRCPVPGSPANAADHVSGVLRAPRTPAVRAAAGPRCLGSCRIRVRSVCQGMAAANGRRSMKLQPSKGAVRTARGALPASSAGPAARTAPRTPGASPGTDPAARSRRAFAAGRPFPQALQADQTCGELHRTGLAPRPTRPRSPVLERPCACQDGGPRCLYPFLKTAGKEWKHRNPLGPHLDPGWVRLQGRGRSRADLSAEQLLC